MGNTTVIEIKVTEEDAKKLLQAFQDGKLAELGVVSVAPIETQEKRWTESNRVSNDKSRESNSHERS